MDREIKRKRFQIEQEEVKIQGKRAKSTGDAGRDHGGGESAEDPRSRDEGGGGGSCDGEVEEFFAILRRIHVAVEYFERSKSRSRSGSSEGEKAVAETPKAKGKAATALWSPNFRPEDFGGDRNGNGNGNKRTVGDNVWLDLNVKPDPADE